jgi:N-acetylglucosamine-6-phosphate deacetylase
VPTRPARPRKRARTKRRAPHVAVNQVAGIITPDEIAAAVVSFGHRILRIEKGHRRNRNYDRILPGFIDLQVNGACGIDVMSATADDLLELSHCLAHEGTTGWLPTVITSPLDAIERIDAIIAEAMAAQADMERAARRGSNSRIGATILGMHLEGPFISPARRGAHPPLNLLPQGDALKRVLRLKSLKLITLAPELDGALDAIRLLTARGIAVSIGHTDATYDQAMAGVAAGARMFTHVFNAMPPLHHRAPGAAGAALSRSAAMAAVIPDDVHLHPSITDLVFHARGPAGMILTTDRVALARTDAGEVSLFGVAKNGARVEDGAARMPNGTLAGSLITMLEGARQMAKRFDEENKRDSLHNWKIASMTASNPARLLHLIDRGELKPRARADLILLDRELNLKAVFVGGRELD